MGGAYRGTRPFLGDDTTAESPGKDLPTPIGTDDSPPRYRPRCISPLSKNVATMDSAGQIVVAEEANKVAAPRLRGPTGQTIR